MSYSYFYILSLRDDTFYYGSTRDLKARVARHQKGLTSLKNKLPLHLVYFEGYSSYTLARKRELAVKKNAAIRQDLKARIIHGPVV